MIGEGDPTLVNCTFSANEANAAGGGVYIAYMPQQRVVHSISLFGTAASRRWFANPTLTNCVFWGNVGGEIVAEHPRTTKVTYSNVQGGWPGLGNIASDPLFTGNHRLSPGSPCIDAGDNTAVSVGLTTDLFGRPRFLDDPATPDTGVPDGIHPIVDMGAREFQP